MTGPELVAAVQAAKLPLAREKDTQRELGKLLDWRSVTYEREHRLSDRDVVDFMLAGGVAVECKLRGGRKAIYKQLRRYATHDEVTAIVLVTNTSMGMPFEIEGKPSYYASLGAAWL